MKYILTALFFIIISSLSVYSQSLKIFSKTTENNWNTAKHITVLENEKFFLKVEKIADAHISWFQITADLDQMYKNANHPWEKDPYKWIGFDTIFYKKRERKEYKDQWIISPQFLNEQECSRFYRSDLGSFWIQAVITLKDYTKIYSPGLEQTTYRGISPDVFRISILKNRTYLGYLTSFFNVPGIFGSIPYQSNNYIGVDCADVIMAAYHKWKNIDSKKDYNVSMVVNTFRSSVKCSIENGDPDMRLTWGKDIFPGNAIAVKYHGRRFYQHIGALYSDLNNNGYLDSEDIVIHAGPLPLHLSKLKDGNFDGDCVIMNLK